MSDMAEDGFESAGEALDRLHVALEESINAPEGSLLIDGTIQRFEFTIDSCWKLFRKLIISSGQEVEPFPKPVLRKAYSAGWLHDETLWLNMMNDRNKTSHTYNQALAKEIYERIRLHYYPAMRKAYGDLKLRYSH